MHFTITSRRCIPASRANSVGVRWIAMEFVSLRRRSSWLILTAQAGRRNMQRAKCAVWPSYRRMCSAFCPRSDRIRHIYELVAYPEALGQHLPEAPDAEGLGRVVPAGDQRDAGLAGVGHRRLLGLAGDERVEARRGCIADVRPAAAGDDPDGRDPAPVPLQHERLPPRPLRAARGELLQREQLARLSDEAGVAAPPLRERGPSA